MFSILHDLLDTSSVMSPGVCKHPRYLMPQEIEKQKKLCILGSGFDSRDLFLLEKLKFPDSENQNIFAIHSLLWSVYNVAIWSWFSTRATTSSRSQEHCGIHQMFRCHMESAQTTKAFGGIKEKTSTWNLDFCPHSVYSICSRTFGHVSGILFN